MRVLYDHQIFSSQPQGGISRYFAELVAADADDQTSVLGWEYSANVHLAETLPGRFHDWWPRTRFKGKAHVTGWWNRGVSRRALGQDRWDLFHPTYYDPYFLPLLNGRPFVLTIHDMTHELFPQGLSDAGVTPRRKAQLARLATRVIAVSEHTRLDAIRLLGLDPELVVTVPHGNSLVPGRVVPEAPASGQPYWLYVGSRSGYKNWKALVEALALRRNPHDRLVMVGGGPLSQDERSRLDAAGLGGRYRQTAATEAQLAGWYAGALALVYPSLYEGFGLPLIEAMAWGCPVVAARSSCLPEVAGDAALWFDPVAPTELAAALDRVAVPGCRTELTTLGAERHRLFTWERTREMTRRVYRQALGIPSPKGIATC